VFQTTTVQQIIDRARVRHWSFTDIALGDGAVLTYLSQRLRTHLARHGATIEGLVNTTMTYTIGTQTGLLVALDPVSGLPVLATTYQDGWPLHVDPVTSIPYFDPTEPMIATDPYGLHGGTPGFPLPSEMIRLIDVSLVFNQYVQPVIIPCDVIREHGRIQSQPGRNPQAFVSGNRLVPVFPYPGSASNPNSNDRWFSVTSLIMSYVALPTLQLLTDYLNIPAVLVEALDADAALMMARQSKVCPPASVAGFEKDALNATLAVGVAGLELVHEPEQETIIYNG
jgi:hypothetical protein